MVEQFAVGEQGEIFAGDERAVFGGQAPDAAMFVVAAGIAKIDFAMLNDGVGPISDVESAVRAEFHVDGTEGDVGGAQDISDFFGGVAGALFGDGKANDAMGAEIAGDGVALPIVG